MWNVETGKLWWGVDDWEQQRLIVDGKEIKAMVTCEWRRREGNWCIVDAGERKATMRCE